ncbi:MAG: bifunctional nuclease family protein [bacterium]
MNGVVEDRQNLSYVVLLREKFGERTLPIWIGEPEALAIARSLESLEYPRPLTHDLLKIVLDAFQAKVAKIEVVALKDETYYAKIYIESDNRFFVIDARPSDSIALAMRTRSTIFVDPKVMDQNGRVLEGDTTVSQLKRRLRDTKPEQFGDFNFKK